MKVVFSENAERDLEEIADWIARDNPIRAISFVEELLQACQALGEAPKSFALVDRRRDSGLRRRIYGNYLIFYDVGESVEILHVLHGARDYERIVFADDDAD